MLATKLIGWLSPGELVLAIGHHCDRDIGAELGEGGGQLIQEEVLTVRTKRLVKDIQINFTFLQLIVIRIGDRGDHHSSKDWYRKQNIKE
jgi:hypothetical protein